MPIKKLPNTLLLANIAFLTANLLWGATGPVIKFTLNQIPPFTLLFLRLLIVCTLLLPYVIVKLTEIKISKKDYLNFFLLGLLAQSSLAVIFVALKFTSVLDTTIISVITGALIVYAGHYFYKEKVHKLVSYGLIITIVGTIFVVLEPFLSGSLNHVPITERLIGNILALIYNLTWVVFVVWSKMISSKETSGNLKKAIKLIKIRPMSKTYPSVLVAAITMYVGLATTIPLAILENFGKLGNYSFNISQISVGTIAGVFYLAICGSITAFTLNQWASAHGKISDSAILSYLGPVFAFPVAFLLLGELPTPYLLIGASIVAIGVIIAEAGNSGKAKSR